MILKIYALIWLLVIAAAAGLLLTGNSSDIVLAVLGFISSTLFFGFYVAILPRLMEKHYTWKY